MTSVGNELQAGKNKALKSLAQLAGLIVYAGMIAYSAVHNWRLLSAGIDSSMVLWAAVGVIALELTALALPIALHHWTFGAMHRIAAFAFYGLDLVLIFTNVILDDALVSQGGDLPGWLQIYKFYALPATPVIAGLGWSLLFLLDPSQRERALTETLAAATREALAIRIAEQAKAADIAQAVDDTAAGLARDIIGQTLGMSTPPKRTPASKTPAGMVYHNADSPEVPAPLPGNGHKTITKGGLT